MEKGKVKVTIASLVYAMIKEGKTNEAIIKAIKKKFPESKISEAHMNWYRRQLTLDELGKTKAKTVSKEAKKKDEDDEDDIEDDEDEELDDDDDEEEDDE